MKHSYQKARKKSITKFPISEMVEHTVARFIFNRREDILAEMSQLKILSRILKNYSILVWDFFHTDYRRNLRYLPIACLL